MEFRSYKDGRIYAVVGKTPSSFLVGVLVFFRMGLWLENWGGVPADVLDRLPKCARRLRGLVYMGPGLRNVRALSSFVGLRTLTLDGDVRHPVALDSLKHLTQFGYGGKGLSNVASALSNPSLKWVGLDRPTGADLARMGANVRDLGLSNPAEFPVIAAAATLRSLAIGNARELDLTNLKHYRSLRELDLGRVRGTVTGFGSLRHLPGLRSLEIDGVPSVDDPEALDDLQLDYLNVWGRQPFTNEQLRAFDARGVAGNRVRIPTPRRPARTQERIVDGEVVQAGDSAYLVHPAIRAPKNTRDDLTVELAADVPTSWAMLQRSVQVEEYGLWWQRVLAWARAQGATTLVVRAADPDADTQLDLSGEEAQRILASPLELSYVRMRRDDVLLLVVNDTIEEGVIALSGIRPAELVGRTP